MKTGTLDPVRTAPEMDSATFDLEESDDLIGLAQGLVNGRHPGILGTVTPDGRPDIRWMSSLAFDHFPVFYSLTNPHSRKVMQIQRNPNVNWMFFNADKTLVLNLIGKARILTDVTLSKRIWKEVEDKEHTYFLDTYGKGLGFVVIETTVETIEGTSPKSALRFAIEPAELAVDDCSFP